MTTITEKNLVKPEILNVFQPLREITVPEILNLSNEVHVELAEKGKKVYVPEGWHGDMKYGKRNKGDALVCFGESFLTIEGTQLGPEAWVDGLRQLNFIFENGHGKELHDADAARIISSEESCTIISPDEEIPVIRAIKNDSQGKIIIEIRNGSQSSVMQELTTLGNDDEMDPSKKLRYRNGVDSNLGNFSIKGASITRKRLGLLGYRRITYFDDCLASGVTIFGDQEADERIGIPRQKTLEEIRTSVASTQGIAIAVGRALQRDVPLLIRTGALAYGLGDRQMGSMYLINVQKGMRQLGLFTVGDMGIKLSNGREGFVHPYIHISGEGNNETRVYLGGGLAMLHLLEERLHARVKNPDPRIFVLRASRINPPEDKEGKIRQWGVILDGKQLFDIAPPLSRRYHWLQ